MASRVYSTVFIEADNPVDGAFYAVPDTQLAIVRDISALFATSPNDTALAVLNEATGIYIAYHLFTAVDEYWHWEGRQVVPGGSTIEALVGGPGPVFVRICGYLLDLS